MDVALYESALSEFCAALVSLNPRVLDLGCGPANLGKYVRTCRPAIVLSGVDLSEEMILLARRNNPGADYIVGDVRDLRFESCSWDGILLGFVAPYLTSDELNSTICDMSAWLTPGGAVYISIIWSPDLVSGPQSTSSGEGPELQIYYHSPESVTETMERNGFRVTSTTHVADKSLPEKTAPQTIIIGTKIS